MPRPWKQWVVDEVSRNISRAAKSIKSGARRVASELARGDWKGAGKRVGLGFLRLVAKLALLLCAVTALFVLTGALVGRSVQSPAIRWLVGALVAVALPLAVQGQ